MNGSRKDGVLRGWRYVTNGSGLCGDDQFWSDLF
jgi:hypothetical protein